MSLFRKPRTTHDRNRRWLVAVLALASAAAAAPLAAQTAWTWQNPRPTSYDVWAVDFADASGGVLVGEGGLLMTTSDGGATWTPRDSGVTIDGTLYRVHHVDADTIVAAGGYVLLTGGATGVVARSTNGGATWAASSPLQNVLFADAYFTDADHGVAVGGDFSAYVPTISRTSDGGATWTTQTLDGVGYLLAVSFPDASTGYAVGYDFAASQAIALATTDGGDTWQPQTIGSDQVLNDVRFDSASHGVAVGNAGTLFVTSDGGATWSSRDAGTTFDLHSVSYNGSTITVTGGDYLYQGFVLSSTDGGDSWTEQPVARSLNYVEFANASNGTAVGSGGSMFQTADGGATWTSQQDSVASSGLFGVAFLDANEGTAVGADGTIVATKDGGQSWHVQTSGTNLILYGVAVASADDRMAVGGDTGNFDHVIVGTTDGGSTWADRTPPDLVVPMLSIACTGVGACTAVGACGTIVHTDDDGATWTTQRPTDCTAQTTLESVTFRDPNDGVAVGIATILRTADGGATWDYQPPPTDQALHAVAFVDADNGYIAGGHQPDRGTILHTTDGGVTWTAQREDLPSPVQAIAFANANEGIGVCLDGSIVRTHDGGTTWTTELRTISNLYGVVYKDNATAVTVGFSNYNAAILSWNDRLFGDGFE